MIKMSSSSSVSSIHIIIAVETRILSLKTRKKPGKRTQNWLFLIESNKLPKLKDENENRCLADKTGTRFRSRSRI